MEKLKNMLGTQNVKIDCLNQNDSLTQILAEEMRIGGPLATRPLIYSILSIKNKSMAQNHFDFMKLTMTEGKNRMIEQIDDSNMSRALDQTTESQSSFIIRKLIEIISLETVYINKLIQLIHLLDIGIALEYRGLIVLDEAISFKYPKLKEIEDYNIRANKLMQKAFAFIDDNFINKASKLQEDFLKNPDVNDDVKNYLKIVGLDWIKSSKNVFVVYKSFKRKTKLTKAQYELLYKFVNEVRQSLNVKLNLEHILNVFNITYDVYEQNKIDALKPIDDFVENIETF